MDRARDMIPPPTRDDVERWSRELESGMVIDRNAPNEGVTVDGVTYMTPKAAKERAGAAMVGEDAVYLVAPNVPRSIEPAADVMRRDNPNAQAGIDAVFKSDRKRPIVQDAPKKKSGAQYRKERAKREREKPLTATVAEVMLGTLAKAKPVKLPKVEEPAPKPVEIAPPVRMVPLPRRPAARCDCGLAVQHTGSDGVGRCTRCATEAYRNRQGAAE